MATIRNVKLTNRIYYHAIIWKEGITKRDSSAIRNDALKWSRPVERNMDQGIYVDLMMFIMIYKNFYYLF